MRAHWDPFWETSPREELGPLVEERLRAQLRWVLDRSPFYREKLGELDPKRFTLDRLPELPFTVKDEVRRSQEDAGPLGAHACVAHLPLLTRDPRRVRTFFPSVRLITP